MARLHRRSGLRPRSRARAGARERAPSDHRPADRAGLGTAATGDARGARADARIRGIRAGHHGRLASERAPRAPRRAAAPRGGADRARGRGASKTRTAKDRSHHTMSSTEALVFDAVRTPRGKGKPNGSLHTVKPVDLVVGL